MTDFFIDNGGRVVFAKNIREATPNEVCLGDILEVAKSAFPNVDPSDLCIAATSTCGGDCYTVRMYPCKTLPAERKMLGLNFEGVLFEDDYMLVGVIRHASQGIASVIGIQSKGSKHVSLSVEGRGTSLMVHPGQHTDLLLTSSVVTTCDSCPTMLAIRSDKVSRD